MPDLARVEAKELRHFELVVNIVRRNLLRLDSLNLAILLVDAVALGLPDMVTNGAVVTPRWFMTSWRPFFVGTSISKRDC
eukprot:872982-Pleurochrysis_carterae.AAC.2